MSDITRTINSAIKTEIATELGALYTELPYVTEIEKNNYRQQDNRYGVLPGEIEEVSGVNRYITNNQTYNIILTKGYGQSSLDDENIRTKSLDLFQLIHQIYKRLITNKAGSPANVMNVSNLNVEPPESLTSEKVVVLRASVTITYRISL